jgi:hypothetical protein
MKETQVTEPAAYEAAGGHFCELTYAAAAIRRPARTSTLESARTPRQLRSWTYTVGGVLPGGDPGRNTRHHATTSYRSSMMPLFA